MPTDASPTGPLVLTQPGSLEQLRRFAAGGYLYALTDGAFSAALIARIEKEFPDHLTPLLHPHPSVDATAIPQLIRVNEKVLGVILATNDKSPWGIFVMTKADPEALRIHFRHFLVVQLPDGEHWYFRFYDPRLLPVYVAKCNQWELENFFGPVRGFGIPPGVESGVTLLHYESKRSAGSSDAVSTDPYMSPIWHIRPEQEQALDKF